MTALPLNRADRWWVRVGIGAPMLALFCFFVLPMLTIVWRSVAQDDGSVGLAHWQALLDTPGVWRAARNSLWLGAATTGVTLLLAFVLSYGLERTPMPGQRFIAATLALPMLAPSLVLGLGLIFLLGRNGLVGKFLGVRPDVYGFTGLLVANVLYALPQAVMILRTALRHGDARQYEAAQVLGASRWRQFVDITVPGVRYGVLSAAFVVFTVTITDFGNAVVIGGNFPVLATEIYNQVSGQMKFGLGAVVGLVLLMPAALSVWIERAASRRQAGLGAETALPPVRERVPARDIPVFLVSLLTALAVIAVIGVVILGSFMRLWPYKLEFTLKHYDITLAGGYAPLWTSIEVSLLTAAVGTAALFGLAWGMRRLPVGWARAVSLAASLPVAVPGLVLGLAYVFAFNTATLPWGVLYGSVWLMVLANFYHYHTQGFLTMSTGMRQVPAPLEEAAAVLGAGMARTVRDVFVPVLAPVLWRVGFFLFMRSMVTLSAAIFLITPTLMVGAVTVMRLDEAGFTSQAAAFSTCIMAVVAVAAAGATWLTRGVRARGARAG